MLDVLNRRADFLAAARAVRHSRPGLLFQARRRSADEPVAPERLRVGFTCSKKVGNAVARNRAKRRLREIARLELPAHGLPGWDYVLVGRPGATAGRAFDDLRADLVSALAATHRREPQA
ncbi:MAG: ribonuclease P protein component [Amaricoccus sp.]|uniref:ribonuclease P protein component n=1 Tax=Amaricoccus sp. TaxID=1872485 RepID=UPI0039E5D381